jgi:uncharacterized protein YdeI (YjbR/CyaY-like superfamily)
MNPKVDDHLKKTTEWREETKRLRAIALGCGLNEELKWGKPCYTLQESNLLIIQGFKNYCALMFCQGALLKDPKGILVKIGQHTQAARQVRFTELRQIVAQEATLKAYIQEAVAAEKAGLKVEYKKNPEPVPEELQAKLDEIPALKKAFSALTPGRQRAYLLYFAGAKQSKTRENACQRYYKARDWMINPINRPIAQNPPMRNARILSVRNAVRVRNPFIIRDDP